jgi:hypothetical protein
MAGRVDRVADALPADVIPATSDMDLYPVGGRLYVSQ